MNYTKQPAVFSAFPAQQLLLLLLQQVKLFVLFGEAVDKVPTCRNQTKKAAGGIMDA